jgi:tetratricopeptide (TPR) repeat protein
MRKAMLTCKSFPVWKWTALRIGVLFAVLLPGALAPAQDVNPTLPLSEAKDAASKLLAESTCHVQTSLTGDGFSCVAGANSIEVRFDAIDYVASRKKSSQWCIMAHDLKNKKGEICWPQKDSADRFASAVNRLALEQNIDWSLSPWRAQRVVTNLLDVWLPLQWKKGSPDHKVSNLIVTKTGITFSGWTDTGLLFTTTVAAQANVSFKDMKYFSSVDDPHCAPIDTQTNDTFCWTSPAEAKKFVRAVNILILENHSEAQAYHQAMQAEFQKTADEWRASGAKTLLPEDAREHKVLAENAVQEKNFKKAINEYEAGLATFPTWPDGQYNVALLCGETGEYEEAVQHMKDYLALALDASDAQAAKDKIIIWRDKISQP